MVEQSLLKPSDPRQVDFNAIFAKDLPDEQVLEDFSCALQERILAHGRIYVTKNFICFYSNLFGVTTVVTPLKNVIGIYKRNTAIVFPNAIEIALLTDGKEQKLFFTSFLFRDQAYQSIVTQWEILRQTTQSQDTNDTVLPNSSKSSDSNTSNSNTVELKDISNSSSSSSSRSLSDSEEDSSEQEAEEIEDVLSSQQSPESRTSDVSTTKSIIITANVQKERKRFEHRSFDDNESSIREERRNSIATVASTINNNNNSETSKQKYRHRSASTSDLGTPTNLTPSSSIKDSLSSIMTSSTEDISVVNTTTTTTTTSSNVNNNESKEDYLTPVVSSTCSHSEEYEEVISITDSIDGEVNDIFSLLFSDKSNFITKVHDLVSYSENSVSKWTSTSGCCIQRELTFISPITARLGPKSTKVTQVQNCRLLSKEHLILDIKSYSKDVPYGDAFIVLVRLHFIKDTNKPSCIIKVAFNVKWLKSIWGPKGLIEKSCIDGMKDFYAKWLPLAKSTMSTSLSPSDAVKSPKKHKSSRKSSSSSKSKEKKRSKDKHLKSSEEIPKEQEIVLQKSISKDLLKESNSSTSNNNSSEFISNTMMQKLVILQSVIIVIILLPLVISNNSRLYYSEQQGILYQQHIRNLETKVTLLRNYIELSNSNDPNDVPILKDYLNSWKSNPSFLLQDTISKLHSQLEQVQSELDHSVKFVNNLRGLEWENSDLSSLSNQSYFSILYPWIPTFACIVVLYILYKKYK